MLDHLFPPDLLFFQGKTLVLAFYILICLVLVSSNQSQVTDLILRRFTTPEFQPHQHLRDNGVYLRGWVVFEPLEEVQVRIGTVQCVICIALLTDIRRLVFLGEQSGKRLITPYLYYMRSGQ